MNTSPRLDALAGYPFRVEPYPSNLVDLGFLNSAVAGEEPHSTAVYFPGLVPPEDLLPEGSQTLRRHSDDHQCLVHARSGSVSLRVRSDSWATVVWLASADPAALEMVRDEVHSRGQESVAGRDDPEGLGVRIWHWEGKGGPTSLERGVVVPSWVQVRSNYPPRVARRLDGLMSLDAPPTSGGRLVLWHGPPGTGKTNAVTAIMQAWSPWCDTHVIADPERLFEYPEYLLEVALSAFKVRRPGRSGSASPWKLIVAEDADEYLRSDARQRSGPALGRLLNMTDGILGQGLKTVVLLTTNDDVGRLHPAVTRPGRCLGTVAFEPFSPTEASEWLGPGEPRPEHPATLAELYGRRNGWANAGQSQLDLTGAYL